MQMNWNDMDSSTNRKTHVAKPNALNPESVFGIRRARKRCKMSDVKVTDEDGLLPAV